METKYKIVRSYQDGEVPNRLIKTGLTLAEAQAHCHDPETSSGTAKGADAAAHTARYGPWFDGYDEVTPKKRSVRDYAGRR
jgi:hypothetical protein